MHADHIDPDVDGSDNRTSTRSESTATQDDGVAVDDDGTRRDTPPPSGRQT